MPTVTHATDVWETAASPHTCPSFAPAVGDLIVVIAAATTITTLKNATLTESAGGGTYSMVWAGDASTGSARPIGCFIRNSFCNDTTSRTLTMTSTGDAGGGFSVYRVAGMLKWGPDAFRNGDFAQFSAGGTPTTNPPFPPRSENPLFGAVANGNITLPIVTQPTGWTEDFEGNFATPAAGLETCHIDSGETRNGIPWGSTCADAGKVAVVELDSSSYGLPKKFNPVPFVQNKNHMSPI
jgi:hypothetical protein